MASYRDGERIPNYTRCRGCGSSRVNGARVSSRGLCGECAVQNLANAIVDQANKSGPVYERWLERMRATFAA